VTVSAPIVRTCDGQGAPALAKGRRGGGCRAAHITQAPERLAGGSIPPAPGSPACGRGTGPQPARPRARPAAAAPRRRRARRAAL